MTDQNAVLAANLEFYRASADRDLAGMDALWARASPVACLHPGWAALTDRKAVIASWEAILANPDAPRVACFDERVLLYGDTASWCCAKRNSPAAPWQPAISFYAKTAFGGSYTIRPVSSPGGRARGGVRRDSIEVPAVGFHRCRDHAAGRGDRVQNGRTWLTAAGHARRSAS
jgi:SnoaL-like domain